MKYQLIDLGRPKTPIYSTAFLITPKGNFMVKGGNDVLIKHLSTSSFPHFFGKILNYSNGNKPYYNLISKGVRLNVRRDRKRRLCFFFESEFGLFKKTRRMPTKWLDCIDPDVRMHLLVSADYLEEKGLIIGAEFLRKKGESMPLEDHVHLAWDRTIRRR
jgi:hypothetical protein